jgi:hypothetical protein
LNKQRIYKYSSIARPLDPDWPANKAVLILLPVALVLGLIWALMDGAGLWPAIQRGLTFALAIFTSWALARELLPDDQVAAFVSMALGFLAAMAYPDPGLLALFATLGLVRIVNRSTGLQARTSDSIIVTLLVILVVYLNQSPWFGAVGALAFFLDGIIRKPLKSQWLFALICLASMVIYIVDHDVLWWWLFVPDTLMEWIAMLAMLLFSMNLVLMKKIHSHGDMGEERLSLDRVKAGMIVAVFASLQGLDVMSQVILLVATIGGLCIGITFRRAFRSPAKGLRSS